MYGDAISGVSFTFQFQFPIATPRGVEKGFPLLVFGDRNLLRQAISPPHTTSTVLCERFTLPHTIFLVTTVQ